MFLLISLGPRGPEISISSPDNESQGDNDDEQIWDYDAGDYDDQQSGDYDYDQQTGDYDDQQTEDYDNDQQTGDYDNGEQSGDNEGPSDPESSEDSGSQVAIDVEQPEDYAGTTTLYMVIVEEPDEKFESRGRESNELPTEPPKRPKSSQESEYE